MIQKEDSQYVITIVLDLSPSFWHLMQDQGKAHAFLMQVIDRYFRDRIGENDKIIISTISGTELALIWEGTPMQLRRDFRSAADFKQTCVNRAFAKGNWGEGGSLVYESIARTVEYITSDQSVMNRKAKSAVFILSDLGDSTNDPAIKERALKALSAFSKAGGYIGLYYVGQTDVLPWRTLLLTRGIKNFIVESEIVSKPDLPSFE